MLLCVCLVLGVWQGVRGRDSICDAPVYRICREPNDWQFPKTEADVDQLCPQVFRHLDCLDDYSAKCGSANDLTEERLQKLRSVGVAICQKDSQIHLNVVVNIAFLNKLVRNDMDACHKYARNKSVTIANYLRKIETEEGHDDGTYDSPYHCLMKSLQIVCFASKSSERYGSDAGVIALEVLGRTGDRPRYCSSSSEDRLEELLALLELEREEEDSLKLIIRNE
ncbi:hypothetical protein AVEN_40098-1 [Araneus ventricosus]|uniref:Secreted protein n=1 Tax=Araneus ventricosus TaxID=182803 RepID=A0A4Y2J1V1_ARAVE|nr:hypothetical protein AVEN_40098-1 [Araneus ventricosus]